MKVVDFALSLVGALPIRHTELHTGQLNQGRLHKVGESYLNHNHLEVSPERGFDCSGFVNYVFAQSIGLHLPRHVVEMFCEAGKEIPIDEMQPADVLFFYRRGSPERPIELLLPRHMAIYAGDLKIVHCSRLREGVAVTALDELIRVNEGGKREPYYRFLAAIKTVIPDG